MPRARTSRLGRYDAVCIIAFVLVLAGIGGLLSTASGKPDAARSALGALPFDLPAQTVLKSSRKKVFANYFPICPISVDNRASGVDYYTEQYLDLNGEDSNFAAAGAVLRERPLPRAVDPSPDWALNDMKTEVRRATGAGLDGFIFDLLALDGDVWERLQLLLRASASVDPSFKIMIMPDGAAPATNDVDLLAERIASIANSSALFRLDDGRLVLSAFAPENQGVEWWRRLIQILEVKYGIPVAFVPTFLDYDANVSAFAPISFGLANWGSRSVGPTTAEYLAGFQQDAHRRGKLWMQPVSLQDNRPRGGMYWEANNTENLRATWSAAMNGADWVQIPTWNDYTENTQISPSTHIGWSPLDLTSYYLTAFKLGVAPKIVRDVVYISHRVQPYGLIPTNQNVTMQLNPFSSPARDTVEILLFLKSPATVTVELGNSTFTYAAPAGLSQRTYPLAPGIVRASVSRTGETATDVSTRFPIVWRRATQDLQYYFVSSGRDAGISPAG